MVMEIKPQGLGHVLNDQFALGLILSEVALCLASQLN